MILRKDKTDPITKLEFDNNMTELMNRIDLSSDQEITGVKTFKSFPVHAVADDDYSTKVANADHMESKVPMFANVAKSGSAITSLKTFNSPVTATGGNVATKGYYDSLNKKTVHFSTELPINPDNNPIAENWFQMDTDGNLIDVFRFIGGRWDLPPKIVKFASGREHIIVELDDGTVWVSGINNYGQLSFPLIGSGLTGGESLFPAFTQLDTLYNNPRKIVCAEYVTFIERSDGVVVFGGDGSRYQSFCGVYIENTYAIVPGITFPNKIVTNGYTTFIEKSDGTVWVCGENYYGQAGTGSATNDIQTPVLVTLMGSSPKKIVISKEVYPNAPQCTFVEKSDGTVWVCGNNSTGMMGTEFLGCEKGQFTVNFIQLPLTNVDLITCGPAYTMIYKDNQLWSSGDNYNGWLFDGQYYGTGKTEFTPTATNFWTGTITELLAVHNLTMLKTSTGEVWVTNGDFTDYALGNSLGTVVNSVGSYTVKLFKTDYTNAFISYSKVILNNEITYLQYNNIHTESMTYLD